MIKLIVCKYIMDCEKKKLYIKQLKELEDVTLGSYLYLIKTLDENFNFTLLKVEKIVEVNKLNKIQLYKLCEDERIEKVITDNFWNGIENEDIILKSAHKTKPLVKKAIKSIIKGKLRAYDSTFNEFISINEERKNYLLKLYDRQPESNFSEHLLRMYDNFEYNMIYLINLSRVYDQGVILLEKNKSLSSKILKKYEKIIRDIIEIEVVHAERKAYVDYQRGQPIGIDSSHNSINLVFGRYSPIEYRINIFSFWDYIKNILTVVLIPCFALFWDNTNKVWLYLIAGIIYLIALIQSDERQSKNILDTINKLRVDYKHRITQISLLKYTFTVSIALGILLFQLVDDGTLFNDKVLICKYLVGDLLLGFSGWYFMMLLGNILVNIVTRISGMKKFQYLFRKCGNVIKYIIKIIILGVSYWFLTINILQIDIKNFLLKSRLEFLDILWLSVSFVTMLIIISYIVEIIQNGILYIKDR